MKIKLLLLVAIVGIISGLSADAAVSVDRTLDQDYLKNNGYSTQIYNTIQVGRARALGQEFYTEEETAKNRKWRKIYGYIDPAGEDFSFYHHDIKATPTPNDL